MGECAMILLFGYGWGVLIAVLLLSLLIPRNSAAWPYIMWGILVLDLVLGSILFAAIQGGLLWYYYSQRRQQRPGPAGGGPAPSPGQPPAGPGPMPGGLSSHPVGCQCTGCLQYRAAVNDAVRRSSRPDSPACKCGAPASAHSASGFCPPQAKTPARYQDTTKGRFIRWIS